MGKILLLFIIGDILLDGMIVVSNTFIPGLDKRVKKKNSQKIASSLAGDVAYYSTYSKHDDLMSDVDSSDEEDDVGGDEIGGYGMSTAKPTISGADWVPVFNDRMTMFIAGAPGAGKSYLAKQMIGLLPDDLDILLFTALEEKDGNFDELGKSRLHKIKMTPEVLSTIKLSEIRSRTKGHQCILLFDDVDKIRESKIQNLVFAIMNDALANGRGHEKHDGKGDIHVICTSHSANDYQKTKYTFENSNYVALFPGTTPPLQMYRMFDKLGLEKELCQKMIRLGRRQQIRSIIIHKVVPMYMIFGNKIMLI